MPVDLPPAVLELLRCPQCRGEVVIEERGVRCERCRLLYPSRDGLLDMLIEDAQPLDAAGD